MAERARKLHFNAHAEPIQQGTPKTPKDVGLDALPGDTSITKSVHKWTVSGFDTENFFCNHSMFTRAPNLTLLILLHFERKKRKGEFRLVARCTVTFHIHVFCYSPTLLLITEIVISIRYRIACATLSNISFNLHGGFNLRQFEVCLRVLMRYILPVHDRNRWKVFSWRIFFSRVISDRLTSN